MRMLMTILSNCSVNNNKVYANCHFQAHKATLSQIFEYLCKKLYHDSLFLNNEII